MTTESTLVPRTGKDLFVATRPFAEELPLKSWLCVTSTFVPLGLAVLLASVLTWWPGRLLASFGAGLLLVRAFILFHDFLHGAILRGSHFARALFSVYGLVALTPPRYWQRTHNYHHANVGKPVPAAGEGLSLLTDDIGSYPLMTTTAWAKATSWHRLWYRINRHPLTILFAYVTVFFYSLTLLPLLKEPRKNGECALALLAHLGLTAAIVSFAGTATALFAFILPFAIASALGAYLFFAQHNFPGMRIIPIESWSHFRAALESSSYMKMGPVLQWLTGNIGFHHVHHLNALIPFYRLPEAMAAIPELEQARTTSLHPSDILAAFRLNLWSVERGQLVAYADAVEQPVAYTAVNTSPSCSGKIDVEQTPAGRQPTPQIQGDPRRTPNALATANKTSCAIAVPLQSGAPTRRS